ncbi:PREDICTED: RING-H2 finger protein ATL67 [Nelumbo nucifera]|uniref:RING-type domain-containing protein n=2 Tax=Nelumbo nucifera TaxID=4432 RepID=A0A822ZJQ2_NELNU|nr:PREDICTED: RING-H2 finger protein ATL67 [Nelumbo nucifera]DAD43226.1 TPA_asm: hypothetical protein HUJ06_001456 [Nelumbo nucifera]
MSANTSTTVSATTGAGTRGGGGGGGGSLGYFLQNLSNIGLGYAIAIALGFLVLLSTVLLASYVCCRSSRNRSRSSDPENPGSNPDSSHSNGIILPRIIFVAEDDDDDSRDDDSLVVGLNQAVINSYPKFPFCKSKDRGDSVCSICLCDYKDGEMLRMMPDCHHFFHLCCIDAWLRLNASCPVCRNSPFPTPLSTPLSELVPLSQYPGNRRR